MIEIVMIVYLVHRVTKEILKGKQIDVMDAWEEPFEAGETEEDENVNS